MLSARKILKNDRVARHQSFAAPLHLDFIRDWARTHFLSRDKDLRVHVFLDSVCISNRFITLSSWIFDFLLLQIRMPAKRNSSDEKSGLATKRPKIGKTPVPPVVPDSVQHKLSSHTFLDDTTGSRDGLTLRQFINPQAAKLYNDFHASSVAFNNLL
jgi:hypothetical protein